MKQLLSSPAVRMGLSVSIATGLYGISFGALAVAAGLNRWQVQALSALMFTGGSQFAFVGTLSGGGMSALVAASLLGIRNAVYGAQLNGLLTPRGPLRLLMAHLTIDESFATTMAAGTAREQRRGFWTAGVGVWLLWNLFTFIGAWAGDSMSDPKIWGLDGAAVAAFLGLLWPRLRSRDAAALAIVCALVTVLAVPFTPPGIPLLVAAVVALLMHAVGRPSAADRSAGQSSGVGGSPE
ncbi:AzlC family ABC transporter permease [Brooklawnia propionicigenes]|uniref:AzlC family ABC transporter permease n=1 Tax=Brooklawnia propionicigenes TaxID=3041175 RepID=A0AAN0K7X1_9ACTN|nr:AzlC family ABC transporter permease [Brooklawnia sp. SH051]MEA5121221.1 AzlC family ABC transporter permease [Propionibacterium sp.]BEH03362.1 AzlC family ABC transporter permease [Brooklawnia sp. SH051]